MGLPDRGLRRAAQPGDRLSRLSRCRRPSRRGLRPSDGLGPGRLVRAAWQRRWRIRSWAAFAALDLPYCWFGFAPELFDTPFRGDRSRDLDWEAHSWLCTSPGSLLSREVAVLVGFRWGFQIRSGDVVIAGPSALESVAWNADLPILVQRCPSWRFVPAPPCRT